MITDKTIERNYQRIRARKHPTYRFVEELFKTHGIPRQTFYKYYGRYRQSADPAHLLPQKRVPKWHTRRPDAIIQEAVIAERKKGLNRYEIYALLLPIFGDKTPSFSGIYNILRYHNMNRLSQPQKEEKRKIIKEYAGQMGHIDAYHISGNIIPGKAKRYYLVGLIDDCTRIAWAELVEDVKSLTVMFSTLKMINYLSLEYGIQYEEILSDNGSEFSSRTEKSQPSHPFERMLIELGIKHRYIRPYRPQTNGKIERFWRTLYDDLIDGTTFDGVKGFQDELYKYLIYYNEKRPHQALKGLTPKQFLTQKSQQIT